MESLSTIPILRLFVLITIFIVVALLAFFMLNRFQSASASRRALQSLAPAGQATPSELLRERKNSAWSRLVRIIEASGLDLGDSKPDALREKLVSAGFPNPDAARLYTLIRIALIFLFPAIAIGGLLAAGTSLTVVKLYFVAAFSAILGLLLPAVYLRVRIDRRITEVTNGFPNCLDLMLVCVESGLGLEAAFDRVGREMAEAEPLVSQLLIGTVLSLRAGATREDALRGMAAASHVPEVRSFCTLLIQSDRLGTSVGSTLRVYAAEMRERRRMRAEERAHRLPIIISIPLVICMLPVMLGVLMLPAVIMVLRTLLPAMTGG